MCGIFAVWNREAVFHKRVYHILFKHAEQRGFDGVGVAINNYIVEKRPCVRYSDVLDDGILDKIWENVQQGDVVLGICRAQPETEVDSSIENMQPITKRRISLVHNGAVSESSRKKFSYLGYNTKIDSETIINAYLHHGRNMVSAMENLEGGFAFALYDDDKNCLYLVNDFKPLAVGYFKGYGLIAHSSIDALIEVSRYLQSTSRTGIAVWENYYFDWQPGYTIREIDLDSGVQRIFNFKPNFYHPLKEEQNRNNRELALIICSGGIDSGLSAYLMNLVGYETILLFFNYGQKSYKAEQFAVWKLADLMNVKVKEFNLHELYEKEKSMLTSKEIEVTTGKEDYIKTTAAWVSARNLVFLSYATALAEQEILKNNWKRVYIVGGFSNLSEEGFYPDNSEYFLNSFSETVKYATITWDRIQYLPLMKNVMKYEEWILGTVLGFPFQYTCSCDQAIIKDGEIHLCGKCGSDYLSQMAARMAGVKDPRKFIYNRQELDGYLELKDVEPREWNLDTVYSIIDRLILPTDKKDLLKQIAYKNWR